MKSNTVTSLLITAKLHIISDRKRELSSVGQDDKNTSALTHTQKLNATRFMSAQKRFSVIVCVCVWSLSKAQEPSQGLSTHPEIHHHLRWEGMREVRRWRCTRKPERPALFLFFSLCLVCSSVFSVCAALRRHSVCFCCLLSVRWRPLCLQQLKSFSCVPLALNTVALPLSCCLFLLLKIAAELLLPLNLSKSPPLLLCRREKEREK